jgi:hypothetical protein
MMMVSEAAGQPWRQPDADGTLDWFRIMVHIHDSSSLNLHPYLPQPRVLLFHVISLRP